MRKRKSKLGSINQNFGHFPSPNPSDPDDRKHALEVFNFIKNFTPEQAEAIALKIALEQTLKEDKKYQRRMKREALAKEAADAEGQRGSDS